MQRSCIVKLALQKKENTVAVFLTHMYSNQGNMGETQTQKQIYMDSTESFKETSGKRIHMAINQVRITE